MRIPHWLSGLLHLHCQSADTDRAVTCDPYQLVRCLGSGSVCEVHLALRRHDAHPVVLKMLPRSRASELNQQRFEREWRVLSQLVDSTYFAKLLDCGTASDGSSYFVLESSAELSLWEWVRQQGALPDARTIPILLQIASGLAELHALGHLHGDVTPKNVLLAGESIQIIDLGLTRPLSAPAAHPDSRAPVSGTPAFMSPEACQSPAHLNHWSDIYSFGCLAYFLITAKPPFSGATSIEICWKQIHAPPEPFVSPAAHSPTVEPPELSPLQTLILSCLEKEPRKRPPSMQTIAQRLKSLQS